MPADRSAAFARPLNHRQLICEPAACLLSPRVTAARDPTTRMLLICCSALSTRNAGTMSSESIVANTPSIGAALLLLEHRGVGPISISTPAIYRRWSQERTDP